MPMAVEKEMICFHRDIKEKKDERVEKGLTW